MRERALIHVAGPRGAGKTTFIERLLGAGVGLAICVRAEQNATLRKEDESVPKTHVELRRYRQAGASAVSLYRFPAPNADAFFTSDFMQDYSEAVLIEGDCPIECGDLSVFVAPPLKEGGSLFRRVVHERETAHLAAIEMLEQTLDSPEALRRYIGASFGEPLLLKALNRPRVMDNLRQSMKNKLCDVRRGPPPAPVEHWALNEGYEGIDLAQLVVVNARPDVNRAAAQSLIEDLARMRNDEAIYRDVFGRGGSRVPITAVIADLLNPKDAGLKKALARAKRAVKRRLP